MTAEAVALIAPDGGYVTVPAGRADLFKANGYKPIAEKPTPAKAPAKKAAAKTAPKPEPEPQED